MNYGTPGLPVPGSGQQYVSQYYSKIIQTISITSSYHSGKIKTYPDAILQRCLVHIKRQVKNYLSTSPKTTAGLDFMIIARQITRVKTQEQCGLWLLAFKYWCDQYGQYVNEKSFTPLRGLYWFS